MFKVGDKVRFISVNKLEESFKKYGESPGPGDIEKQRTLQGITDFIVGFDDDPQFDDSILYVSLKNTRSWVGYFHIARLEKINTGIILNDNLFKL